MRLADKTNAYARVAQLVEHDLAKVGVAGSSPVSRFLFTRKRTSLRMSFFLVIEPCRGSKVPGLRSASVGAKPTSTGRRAPSRALCLQKKDIPKGDTP